MYKDLYGEYILEFVRMNEELMRIFLDVWEIFKDLQENMRIYKDLLLLKECRFAKFKLVNLFLDR